MSDFVSHRNSHEAIPRSLSVALTLSLAVACWVCVVAGARLLFG